MCTNFISNLIVKLDNQKIFQKTHKCIQNKNIPIDFLSTNKVNNLQSRLQKILGKKFKTIFYLN